MCDFAILSAVVHGFRTLLPFPHFLSDVMFPRAVPRAAPKAIRAAPKPHKAGKSTAAVPAALVTFTDHAN